MEAMTQDGGEDRMRPPSVSEKQWAVVKDEEREEVVERMGFLVMRGMRPSDAFRAAIKGMDAEMAELEQDDLGTTWHVLRTAARLKPLPWRRADGRYMPSIQDIARGVESTGRAMAGLDHVMEDFDAMGLKPGAAEALRAAAIARRDAIVADAASRFLNEMDGSPLPNSAERGDHPDDESHGYEP